MSGSALLLFLENGFHFMSGNISPSALGRIKVEHFGGKPAECTVSAKVSDVLVLAPSFSTFDKGRKKSNHVNFGADCINHSPSDLQLCDV